MRRFSDANGDHSNNQQRVRPRLLASQGAALTYAELTRFPPQHAVQEKHAPVIYKGIAHPTQVKAIGESNHNTTNEIPPIYLVRADTESAIHAYAKIPDKQSISLSHHGPNWGDVWFGIIYKRQSPNCYRCPAPERAQYVAIKVLNKAAVRDNLRKGGEENPYKEISRMQELGDNQHVLQCIEALEDETYLYIITPKACRDGTLKDAIPWFRSNKMEPSRVYMIFSQILQILLYLEEHSICHRDLSPDNFLFLTPDNLVVYDLALSQRIPHNGQQQQQRTLLYPSGSFGTRAYMAPELFRDKLYDGVGVDLWSATIILYNMMTGQILYHMPFPSDILFRYFILAKGLSSQPVNERTIEILMEQFKLGEQGPTDDRTDMMNRAMAHLTFPPSAVQLFENLFALNPAQRWTLSQTIESDYAFSDGNG
jgi:serine/threonine protein kinase